MGSALPESTFDLKKTEPTTILCNTSSNESTPQEEELFNTHYVDEESSYERKIAAKREKSKVLRKMGKFERYLEKRFGIETSGFQKIPEHKRQSPSKYNMILLWFTSVTNPAGIAMGLHSVQYGLSLSMAIGLSIAAVVLGSCIPAFTSIFSAKLGLRQIAASRYAFGIYGSKLLVLLLLVNNIGYGINNIVTGAELLTASFGKNFIVQGGVAIMGIPALLMSIVGFKAIHKYLPFLWIPMMFFMFIHLSNSGAKYGFVDTPHATGADYAASCLTYFAVVLGWAASWSTMVGDYYVHYPSNTSTQMIFSFTWIGLAIPAIVTTIVGNCIGSIAFTHPMVGIAYRDGGIGGLLVASASSEAFGRVLCGIYGLSAFGNIVMYIYSCSVSTQLWGGSFAAGPRFQWCFSMGAKIVGASLMGATDFQLLMGAAMPIITPCFIPYGVIMFQEHFIFRKHVLDGYDGSVWQDKSRMPWGLAAVVSFLGGYALGFLGIDQAFYVGPLSTMIGSGDGADVGIYPALAGATVLYPVLRMVEIKLTGR